MTTAALPELLRKVPLLLMAPPPGSLPPEMEPDESPRGICAIKQRADKIIYQRATVHDNAPEAIPRQNPGIIDDGCVTRVMEPMRI